MSDRPTGGGFPWPVSLWLLATMAFAAVSVSVLGDVLSPSLLLDLAAFWPFLAVAVLTAVLGAVRGGGFRVVAPLAVIAWLATTMALHLSGASFLPSVVGRVTAGVGTEGIGAAEMVIGPVDAVEIGFAETDQLVTVTPTREGGDVAPAVVTPFVGDGRAEIVVAERPDPGYFLFSGWIMDLAVVDAWNLDIQANDLVLDTTRAVQVDLTAAGDGTLRLAEVAGPSVAVLTGGFDVIVPRGVGVIVEGEAATPRDWSDTERGSRSPEPDVRWTITVVGGSQVTVSYEGA